MDIDNYLYYEKELQVQLLSFFDDSDENSLRFLISIENEQIQEKHKLKELLDLILHVLNNHHRPSNIYEKIGQILSILKSDISKFFTKKEILEIFKSNKLILLYLIESKIIESNKRYFYDAISTEQYRKEDYLTFFYNEIKNFLPYQQKQEIETKLNQLNLDSESFKEKRKIGENDSLLCSYIRNDSVEKFIKEINQRKISLNSTIEPSIFETNQFLINKKTTLIEYSAFYGSIQIFQYLCFNNITLSPSLWIFSVHGSKPELIHILEENKVFPKDKTYVECAIESIKCHYIGLSDYFIGNFVTVDESVYENESLKYFNYYHFPKDLKKDEVFFNLVLYNYNTIVEILLSTENINVNTLIVFNQILFLNKISKKIF